MSLCKNLSFKKHFILVCGLVMMLCVGILYLWSILQPHVIEYYGWESGQVSMTSAIMIASFVLGNISAGFVQERIPPKITAIIGSCLFAAGIFFSSSVGPEYPFVMYLTYGVMGGAGCGIIYSVVLAVLQKWFAAKMGFITGIAVGFFGLSVVLLSPIVEVLIVSLGLPKALKMLAICFFLILIAASLGIKNPTKEYYYSEVTKAINPENVKQFTPARMLKTPSFYYIFIATVASSAAFLVIVPFIYTIAILKDMQESLALVSVMGTGAANAIGRILAPALSDKIGRTRTIILCAVISAGACLLIISARGLTYTAAVFFIALAYGGVGGTNPVITTELFGARHSGANYGLVMLSIAFSSLFFGKISAALGGSGNFTTMFISCAIICIVPVIMMFLLRKRCKRLGKDI